MNSTGINRIKYYQIKGNVLLVIFTSVEFTDLNELQQWIQF